MGEGGWENEGGIKAEMMREGERKIMGGKEGWMVKCKEEGEGEEI